MFSKDQIEAVMYYYLIWNAIKVEELSGPVAAIRAEYAEQGIALTTAELDPLLDRFYQGDTLINIKGAKLVHSNIYLAGPATIGYFKDAAGLIYTPAEVREQSAFVETSAGFSGTCPQFMSVALMLRQEENHD